MAPFQEIAWHLLGFGVRETEITFPISRSFALVGSFHDQGVVSTIERKLVGLLNRRTLDSAQRFIYSSGEQYLVTIARDEPTRGKPGRDAKHRSHPR